LKISKQKPEEFNKIPLEELEQRLIIEKSKIINLDEQLKKQETELALQNNRPQLIREQTVQAKQELENTEKKLQLSLAATSSDLESEAQLDYLKSQVEARSVELKMLDVEAISNPARVELLKTELQLLSLQKAAANPIIQAIEDIISEFRLQQAKQMQDALSQTEKELSGKHQLIQVITRENIQYSRDLQNISAKIEQFNEQKAKIDAKNAQIETDFKSAEKKISLAGLSPTLGKILREQRRGLSDPDQELQLQNLQNETALASLEQFKVEDRLNTHTDIDAELNTLIDNQVDHNLPAEQRMMIQAELRVLLNSQKDLLNKLLIADTTFLRTLGDLDFAIQQMAEQAKKFAVYLDERLLWVPSSEPINGDFISGLYHSGQWLLSPFNWLALSKDMVLLAFRHAFLAVLAVLSLTLVWLCRNRAKQQLTLIAQQVEKIYSDNFYYTLQALAYTLVLILPLPLLMYFIGSVLSNNLQVTDFSKAIGQGLQGASLPLFFLQFFYRLSTPKGIARKHFQWQPKSAELLARQLAWLRFVSVPGQFIISTTNAGNVGSYSDNLGRLAFILVMLAMTLFLSRLFKPTTGLVKEYLQDHPNSWISKSQYIWYSAFIVAPLVIIGFAVTGYYLSALELQQKFVVTLRLVFLIALLHELVVRWLTLVNRQLAIKNARQKRKAAAIHSEKPVSSGVEESIVIAEEPLIDIPKINAQTLQLLHVSIGFSLIIGFWMIWKNILPAFSFLDQIVLWQHQVTTDNQNTSEPITLTNLFLASLYVFVTTVSVRNFSGLMELLVFRRFAIEAGGRYAVNQLAKYLLVSIGFIFVANELGGSWSRVQWLVTALSVGLGFGLQEIFANLVSGIILLFERPIRVGDTVTIGNVDGRVSRIQMRATTLIDFDQKELIVPNKTFITSQLVNWTLSDAITRVVIPVGIAYDSDVDLAYQVILDTVRSTPLVLKDPEPSVILMSFGESALNFSIRIFVSELGNRLRATHDLHMRLEKAFREHHIHIPFPQREVHVRHSVDTDVEELKREISLDSGLNAHES
ncbi:MAG: mechanosensitive ion channel domain-containing protein, partial [Methylococcales bacterium]